jgi:predicted Zn-dependent peptidase
MRTLIFLLLSFLASGLALAGVRIEHWTAPSGARVYFVETRVVPILDVQIDFAGGGAFVPAAKSGLAGLTRSLLEAGAGDMDEERIAGGWWISAPDWAAASIATAPASACARCRRRRSARRRWN